MNGPCNPDCALRPTSVETVPVTVRNGVAVASASQWIYTWDGCKFGSKMLLLTEGGIAVIGQISKDTRGYIAWAPLPDRDAAKEKEAGLR